MTDEVRETVTGDGYAVSSIDGLGEGPGFRKIRQELGVNAFGVNAIVIPEGAGSNNHWHDEQEELYIVQQGQLEFVFGDESRHLLGPGGLARVDAQTLRQVRNVGEGDAVYVCVGGKDGYVGRDGRMPEGESRTTGG